MDFDLTEEQKMMKKMARDFLSKECPKELTRQLWKSPVGHSSSLWSKMAELGWTGLVIPSEYGGSDGSFMDLIILFEEAGYNICPAPLLSTTVLGTFPLLSAGSDDQKRALLPLISGGKAIVTMALTEPSASFDASVIRTIAYKEDGHYIIRGTKLFVPDAHVADYLLCVARTNDRGRAEDGISIFLLDIKMQGVSYTPLKVLSEKKQCELVINSARVAQESIMGRPNQGWPIIQSTLEMASLARCAEMIGGAQAVMDMALQYAKERTQFKCPIGSFQAIQHHFVNMLMDIKGSQYLLYKAAMRVSDGKPAVVEVAMAKARGGEACRRVTTLGHQIFAGIGFTMEHDMHLYHRHSMEGYLSFGDSDFHRSVVAKELGF